MKPGETALTLIPSGSNLIAMATVNALRAEGISVLLLALTAASEKHLSSEFPPLWRSSSRRRGHSGLARVCGGCRQSCRVIRHLLSNLLGEQPLRL